MNHYFLNIRLLVSQRKNIRSIDSATIEKLFKENKDFVNNNYLRYDDNTQRT